MYLNKIVAGAALLVATLSSSADAGPESVTDKRTGVFGVTVKGRSPILTRKLVQAASDAASAYGIQKQHTIEAMDGIELGKLFDSEAMNEAEKAYVRRSQPSDPLQPTYIVVKGFLGGGCIAAPTYELLARDRNSPQPVGVTNMRCAKSEEGFARLMKVALVAMAI